MAGSKYVWMHCMTFCFYYRGINASNILYVEYTERQKEKVWLVMARSGSNAWPGWPWGSVTWLERLSQFPFLPPPGMRLSGQEWKMCRRTELRADGNTGHRLMQPPSWKQAAWTAIFSTLITHLGNYTMDKIEECDLAYCWNTVHLFFGQLYFLI